MRLRVLDPWPPHCVTPSWSKRAYGGLGVAYAQLKKPNDAIDNLMKALDIARKTN